MSDYFKKSEYTDYQKETQWLNLCMGAHDLLCFCDKPWMHLLQSVIQRGNFFELDQNQVRIIQKCLTTTSGKEDTTSDRTEDKDGEKHTEKDGFDLDLGDLEILFGEDKEQG